MLRTSIDAPEIEDTPRMTEVRRRIREGYYNRAEVRRSLSRKLLRRLAQEKLRMRRERPKSA